MFERIYSDSWTRSKSMKELKTRRVMRASSESGYTGVDRWRVCVGRRVSGRILCARVRSEHLSSNMSFSASKSSRLVDKNKDPSRSPTKRSSNNGRPGSPEELAARQRAKKLGLNYLRNFRNSRKQAVSPAVNEGESMAQQVMERIKFAAAKSGTGLNLNQMFRDLDVDSNGTVDQVEFFEAMNGIGVHMSKDESDAVFAAFDPNNTGGIDYEEFVYSFYNRRTLKSPEKSSTSLQPSPDPSLKNQNAGTRSKPDGSAWRIATDEQGNKIVEYNSESPTVTTNGTARKSRWDSVRKLRLSSVIEGKTLDEGGTPPPPPPPPPSTLESPPKNMSARSWAAIHKHVRRTSSVGSSSNASTSPASSLGSPASTSNPAPQTPFNDKLMRRISSALKSPGLSAALRPRHSINTTSTSADEAASSPLVRDLQELGTLKKDGILSEQEFLLAKKQLLVSNVETTGRRTDVERYTILVEELDAWRSAEREKLEREKEEELTAEKQKWEAEQAALKKKDQEEKEMYENAVNEAQEKQLQETRIFKEKLDETRKQLRHAFTEKAEMARSIRQMKAKAAEDEAAWQKAREEERERITIYSEETAYEDGQASELGAIRTNVEKNSDATEVIETPRSVSLSPSMVGGPSASAKQLMKVIWKNYHKDYPGKKNARQALTASMTEPEKPEHVNMMSAIGFADVDGAGKKLTMIRLYSNCLILESMENIGRVDKIPKLVRANHIVVVNVKGNHVQIILESSTEIIDVYMMDDRKAVGFAQQLHLLIQEQAAATNRS